MNGTTNRSKLDLGNVVTWSAVHLGSRMEGYRPVESRGKPSPGMVHLHNYFQHIRHTAYHLHLCFQQEKQ